MMQQMSIFELLDGNNYFSDLREDMPTRLIAYIDFKNWLYYNYPMFIDKEIHLADWEYRQKGKTISVTTWTNSDTRNIFVSVGCDFKESGSHRPCFTLMEVRKELNNVMRKDYKI